MLLLFEARVVTNLAETAETYFDSVNCSGPPSVMGSLILIGCLGC